MRILVTGSSGHLGEALVRTLRDAGREVVGLDVQPSPFTDIVGSIADQATVAEAAAGVGAILHAATLHKPHVVTHSRHDFVSTNIAGTLNLLEAALAGDMRVFVYTSTTSVFGRALTPAATEAAAWITEDVAPVPRNIYGVTKKAAEDLCELFHHKCGLPCVVLRTSRFFADVDDDPDVRSAYSDQNVKANEYLYRRVDIADVVTAHVLALEKASALGFGRYIISTTTPFVPEDAPRLRTNVPDVVRRLFPKYELEYARRGWKMFPRLDRVYANDRARRELGWEPVWTFERVLEALVAEQTPGSALASAIGIKSYHAGTPAGQMYPTE